MGSDLQFRNDDMRFFDDLTDEEQGLLLLAFYRGKTIQERRVSAGVWENVTDKPNWGCGIFRIAEPRVVVQWANDSGPSGVGWWYDSRETADDASANRSRAAVIRRTMIDGKVVSYHFEEA